jgi:hypothetical protein
MRSVFEALAILLIWQLATISLQKSSSSANDSEHFVLVNEESLLMSDEINANRRSLPLLRDKTEQDENGEKEGKE